MAEKTTGADNKISRKRRLRPWLLGGLALVFIILGVIYAIYYFTVARYYVSTEDAYVHGNTIMLTPQITGTVIRIAADNTDLVHAGQSVIVLDSTDQHVALEKASANLAETLRAVRQLYANKAEQQAVVAQRQAQLDQARADYARDKRLLAAHGVSRKDFQHARLAKNGAQAQLAQAQHKLEALQAQTAETTPKHHPRVLQAIAAVRTAWLNLHRDKVPSPVTGYVAKRRIQVGEKARPGEPMLAIVPLNQVWVQANFKETQLAQMRIGQPVKVTADLYGDNVTYHGHIAGISPGTGSAFELLPPQNATGNWIKVVRRVPVRIRLDADELRQHPLRLGLSLHAQVNLHDTSGKVLADTSPSKPAAVTTAYHSDNAALHALIARILAANDGQPPAGHASSTP